MATEIFSVPVETIIYNGTTLTDVSYHGTKVFKKRTLTLNIEFTTLWMNGSKVTLEPTVPSFYFGLGDKDYSILTSDFIKGDPNTSANASRVWTATKTFPIFDTAKMEFDLCSWHYYVDDDSVYFYYYLNNQQVSSWEINNSSQGHFSFNLSDNITLTLKSGISSRSSTAGTADKLSSSPISLYSNSAITIIH